MNIMAARENGTVGERVADVELVELLREIRELVRPYVQRALYTKQEACRLLSCSMSKLNQQIREGELFPTRWGGQWMVARSEIERISAPTARLTKRSHRPVVVRLAPSDEAARAREALRARRKG